MAYTNDLNRIVGKLKAWPDPKYQSVRLDDDFQTCLCFSSERAENLGPGWFSKEVVLSTIEASFTCEGPDRVHEILREVDRRLSDV